MMVENAKEDSSEVRASQAKEESRDKTLGVKELSGEDGDKWRLAFKTGTPRKSFYDRKRAHYREYRRRDLDIPVDLEVISPEGMIVDRGQARLVNMSATGVLLADVELDNGRYPVGPFHLLSQLKGTMAEGIVLKCQPVRLDTARGGMGCLIEDIDCSVED